MKYIPIRLLSVLLIFSINFAIAQHPVEPLKFNKLKTVHLDPGQVFKYNVILQKGQFASLKVHQKSVGIGYAVYAPSDSLIISDDLNALYQTEVINIFAEKTGTYQIEIFWDYGRPQSGDFTIIWNTLENTGKSMPLRADQLMKSWYPQNEAGAAIVVLKNNKVIFKSLKGLANLEYKIPITDSSTFELASCSKQFTGFAIAMLINQGLISLDDDVRNYLPELPDFGKKITIGDLIYHTSGLRNWDAMSNAMGLRPDDVLTIEMIYKMICSTSELNFVPNEKFSYTNTGYNLLALILERVTHNKFSVWMTENIFNPLDMKNTLVKDDINKVIANKVYSYKSDFNGFTANTDDVSAMGSTSVYSSINDLTEWVKNFNSGKVGGKNVLTLLNKKSKLNNGDSLNFYSFGNGFGSHKGIANIEHLGLISGFRTVISRYPEQNLAIVFLSNDNNDAAYNHCWAITDLFLQNEKQQALQPIKLPDLKEALITTMPYKATKCPVDTKEYEGIYYAAEINSHYKLINKDGVLTAISYRFDDIELKWEKTDRFSSNFKTFDRRFEFVRDENKFISAFKLTGGDKEILFSKLKY